MSKTKLQLLQDSLSAAKATNTKSVYILSVASKAASSTVTLIDAKFMNDETLSQDALAKKIIHGIYRHNMMVSVDDDTQQVITPNTIGFIKKLNETITEGTAIDLNLNVQVKNGKPLTWINPVRQELTVDDLESKSFDLD